MLKASDTLTWADPKIRHLTYIYISIQAWNIYQTSRYFSKNVTLSLCITTLSKCNSYQFRSDWNWTMFGDYYASSIERSKD